MMLITETHLAVQKRPHVFLLDWLREKALEVATPARTPVRFVAAKTSSGWYLCELGLLSHMGNMRVSSPESIFRLIVRRRENCEKFTAVLVVPTGIGAEIGGHAGDAGPVARLLAAACDTLVTHPNVVNASDINELPENGLYVEGSVLCRLLMGTVGLQRVRSNRVLLVIDRHSDQRIMDLSINAVQAARAAFGLDCSVVAMDSPIKMCAEYADSGRAAGSIEGVGRLCEILVDRRAEYDAVAIHSQIQVPDAFHMQYFESQGEIVNPWGGVEAMLTHTLSMLFNVPSAHAPMIGSWQIANMVTGVVDPRMSAEAISNCYLHCVLKGLHRSPRIVTTTPGLPGLLSCADVSCLVIPDGCLGLPTLAAMYQGIPVIAVRNNRNLMRNDLTELPFAPGKLFIVDNYLEAAGVMTALRAGVTLESVRRPLKHTTVEQAGHA